MKHLSTFSMLVLGIASIGVSQDDTAVEPAVVGEAGGQEEAASDDADATSPLEQLDWMVGTWIDQGEDSKISTTCSWRMNRKFLTRSFRVTIEDQITLAGNQVIGWDPIAGQIRSWTFDTEGGIGQGRWIRDGNRWLVKKSFVLASGERASAINIITYVDQDTLRWQSTNREVAGELQPNIAEVTVVRQKDDDAESKQGEAKEVSQ
jgi:hypothetical protein